MSISVINITLDVTDESIQTSINVKQNDTSRKLKIQLTDGGVPAALDPNDMFAVLMVRKPNGDEILNRCELRADGVIIYELTTQTTAAVGQNLCEVRVYDTTAYETITSARFMMHVRAAVYDDDDVESASEYTALTAALTAADNIDVSLTPAADNLSATLEVTDRNGDTESVSVYTRTNTANVVFGNDSEGAAKRIPYKDTASPNSLVLRTSAGTVKTATPTAENEATNKGYVDSALNAKADADDVDTELAKKLDLTGGTLEGTLDMDMHPIFNILTAYDSDSYMATNVEYVQAKLAGKANTSDVYSISQTDAKLAQKANTDDVYTISQTDAKFAEASQVTSEISRINEELAAKADADDTTAALAAKANAADVYNKSQTYTKSEVNSALATKADKSTVYTQTETDALLGDKADADSVVAKSTAASVVYATTSDGAARLIPYAAGAPTGSTIAMRDVYGRLKTAYPEINADAATKKYVDDAITAIPTKTVTVTYTDGTTDSFEMLVGGANS